MTEAELRLIAPIGGRIVPLGDVPDPMFAMGMMGDGIAVEPSEGEVRAPCAGTVVSLHRRGHAVKIKAETGAEVLVHVGLEAVAMRGEGFRPAVAEGDTVAAGDLLIRFDLDRLRADCGLVTTPVVVANEAAFTVVERHAGGLVDALSPLMTVRAVGSAPVDTAPAGPDRAETTLVLELEQGLHARPAAALVATAKAFGSTVRISLGDRSANAKSAVSLLTLGSRWGSRLTVTAEGADAQAAVSAIATAISSGLGDPVRPVTGEDVIAPAAATVERPADPAPPADTTPFPPDVRVDLRGVTAAPGLAIGRAHRIGGQRLRAAEQGGDPAVETEALERAVETVRAHTLAQAETARTVQQREIMNAHATLLDDPDLIAEAKAMIAAGKSAGFAWSRAIEAQTTVLASLDNARLAERVADLVDLDQQVLAVLTGAAVGAAAVPDDAVVVAEDILPSQFMAFGDRPPLGIVLAKGGRTSHAAILAASSGIPMLAAVGVDALRIPDGMPLIVDADRSIVSVNPPDAAIAESRRAHADREERRKANRAAAAEDCMMADGTRIQVLCNIGSVADAERGFAFGAEGSGLLRTEFLFLERREAPTEAEQLAEYQAIADALHGRPLTIRTLDVGGDKPIPYLAMGAEENPILGVRGIRVCRRHPEILRTQFRAALRVSPVSQVRIMLPMIADVTELRWARGVFEDEKARLGVSADVPLGIMIEVPAAVALADRLAREADFFSVGTNDLTQYVLAMDRGNTDLAAEVDAFHPAVLRMIGQAAAGAKAHGRPMGVCGGLASELLAAPLLIGLGVTSLSATRSSIPDLKAFIRTLDLDACRAVAAAALDLDDGEAVRALVRDRWSTS